MRELFGAVLGILLLTADAAAQEGKDVYRAPSPEPTPAETLILEYINRFRADPAAAAVRIAPPGKTDFGVAEWKGVDWEMFRREVKALKPGPPMVFNLALLDSARKHSHYVTLNGIGHEEVSGRAGFTGVRPSDRAKAAGYTGPGAAENTGTGHRDSWHSYRRFIVDAGPGGPGGMQPRRGHRMILAGRHKEIGVGMVPNGRGSFTVTHNLGARPARMAGGVVYIDKNGNEFYDVDEGVGGRTIVSSDGARATTWASGAYAMDLKGKKRVTLSLELEGKKHSKTFGAGEANIKFDWAIPLDRVNGAVDRHLAKVGAISDTKSSKYRQAVVNLYWNTRGLCHDPDRKKRVEGLTAEVRTLLEANQKKVREVLSEVSAAGIRNTLDECRKPFRRTDAEGWFNDAELVAKLSRGVAGFLARPKRSERDKKAMVAMLEASGKRLKRASFHADLDVLIARVRK